VIHGACRSRGLRPLEGARGAYAPQAKPRLLIGRETICRRCEQRRAITRTRPRTAAVLTKKNPRPPGEARTKVEASNLPEERERALLDGPSPRRLPRARRGLFHQLVAIDRRHRLAVQVTPPATPRTTSGRRLHEKALPDLRAAREVCSDQRRQEKPDRGN